MGRPRLYFIVDDEQGKLWSDGTGLYVTGAKDADGFARARFELPIYSHRNTGKADKRDDDFVDAFRGLMNRFGVRPDSKTKEEKIEEALEEKGLAMADIEPIEDERDKLAKLQVRLIEQQALRKPQTKYPRVATRWR
jgi:hypothetical protein